jgi:hypothetical protein
VSRHRADDNDGGDKLVGGKLLGLMQEAGYLEVKAQSRYQNYEDLPDRPR